MKILVTSGVEFIGLYTDMKLMRAVSDIVNFDDLISSSEKTSGKIP